MGKEAKKQLFEKTGRINENARAARIMIGNRTDANLDPHSHMNRIKAGSRPTCTKLKTRQL